MFALSNMKEKLFLFEIVFLKKKIWNGTCGF